MRILVSGSWQEHKARDCKEEAQEIGRLLAERGHEIVSGGGTGISKLVVESYRNYGGTRFTCYIPSEEEMKRVGENLGPKPDILIETKTDYPERNIILVRNCDALIALQGGTGTLTEVIHASKDYGKPTAVIDRGDLATWIKEIKDLEGKVLVTTDITRAISYLENGQ